jgi:hypothetical protein
MKPQHIAIVAGHSIVLVKVILLIQTNGMSVGMIIILLGIRNGRNE